MINASIGKKKKSHQVFQPKFDPIFWIVNPMRWFRHPDLRKVILRIRSERSPVPTADFTICIVFASCFLLDLVVYSLPRRLFHRFLSRFFNCDTLILHGNDDTVGKCVSGTADAVLLDVLTTSAWKQIDICSDIFNQQISISLLLLLLASRLRLL